MNKLIKYISIIFLVSIYCFALCISNIYVFPINIDQNSTNTHSKSYHFSNSSFNLLSYIIKNEKLVNHLNKLPNSFEKRQYYDSIDCKHSKEIIILSTFSKYILKDKFTYKFFTSTDIIYPFHYFW